MSSSIFIAPPGAGKTTFMRKHPGMFLDPETSIDWKCMDARHSLYPKNTRQRYKGSILEHELDWPTVWIEEVLPRLRAALILERPIMMGLVTPSNAEIVSRFLQAFRKTTALILPPEKQHYRQIWDDEKKRVRSWGPQLRGWQHTFWIRMLLLGLATDLDLKIMERPNCPTRPAKRKMGQVVREAAIGRRKFMEVFYGRWAELDSSEEIVAMHEAQTEEEDVRLICDRTSKACGKGLHDCDTKPLLQTDISGHALSTWIPQDKLRLPSRSHKKNAVIFFVGTLAPFHHGHLDLLHAAKKDLEAKGWHVIGGYVSTFASLKKNRVDDLSAVLGPIKHRQTLLQLGLMQSDWLMADLPTEHVLRSSLLEQGNHPIQLLIKRLREHEALSDKMPVTTFWVNGKDAYLDQDFFRDYAHSADADALNPQRMLIVDNRPGENSWSASHLAASIPSIVPFVDRCKASQTNPTSATAVREALRTGNHYALKETVGLPLVEAYLMGLMHKQESTPQKRSSVY